MKNYCVMMITFLTLHAKAQLNELDSTGKKHGKWILYLDAYGNKLTDSTGAAYYRYTWYDHGKHLYPMGGFITRNGKLIAPDTLTGKPQLLNGEYQCLDKKGRVKFVHVFKNGEYMLYQEFYKSGQLKTQFDYSKQYNGQAHSWYMEEISRKGKMKSNGYFRKDDDGRWPNSRG